MKFPEKAKIPNIVTSLRVVCIPALWVLALLQWKIWWGLLLGFAGLTDAVDGFLARRWGVQSAFGSWFDSFADNLLSASVVFWALLLFPEMVWGNVWIVLILLAMFVTTLSVGFIKYGRMVSFHLYSGKIANVFMFVFLFHASVWSPSQFLLLISAGVIALSLLEEIMVIVTKQRYDDSIKTFFSNR